MSNSSAAPESVVAAMIPQPIEYLKRSGWNIRHFMHSVLSFDAGRPVIRYTIQKQDVDAGTVKLVTLIAKGYYHGDGRKSFAVTRELWEEIFVDEYQFTIAEPIAYSDADRIMLQREARGIQLVKYLSTPRRAEQQVALAARWLALFHAVRAIPSSVPLVADSEIDRLRHHVEFLQEELPQFGSRFRELASYSILFLSNPREILTHGDYQPKNIFVDSERVTVIDFDRCALASRERDIGNFLAQSSAMYYGIRRTFSGIESWNDAFLAEYAKSHTSNASHIAAHLIRTFIEIIYYKIFLDPLLDLAFVPTWLALCEDWQNRA